MALNGDAAIYSGPVITDRDREQNGQPTTLNLIDQLSHKLDAYRQKGDTKSWAYGVDLHDLGVLEMRAGDNADAQENLLAAQQVLRTAQDRPKDGERKFTQALVDLSDALIAPKPNQKRTEILKERRMADEVLDEAFKRASTENRSRRELADLLRDKGDNEMFIASAYNPNTVAGKKAYRQEMQRAIETLGNGLKLVENGNENDDIGSKALLLGDLAMIEMHRADGTGDPDAKNAQKHYREAIKDWHDYDPNQGVTDPLVASSRADSRDKALLIDLSQYSELEKLMGSPGDAADAEKEMEEILQKHPDFRLMFDRP